MNVRLPLCFAIGWLVVLLPQIVRSQTIAPIEWVAPEGCPSLQSFQAEVAQLLGGADLLAASGLRASAEVDVRLVSSGGARYELRLRTQLNGLKGARVLAATDCGTIARAAALILAMTIDPTVGTGATLAKSNLAVVSPALSSPPAHFAGGLIFGALQGTLPKSVGKVGLQVERFRSHWGARLTLGTSANAHSVVPDRTTVGGNFRAVSAALAVCSTTLGAWQIRLCTGAAVDRVTGSGFGVSDPGHNAAWAFGPFFDVGPALAISRHLSLVAGVGAGWSLVRPRFVLRNVGLVHQSRALNLHASFAFLIHF